MRFSTRDLVMMAVFGTLWGGLEIGLGSVLHAVNMPMSGALLSAGGLWIALSGRLFVPRRGSIVFVGAIAMVLKLFSIGSIVVGPMIGILAEAAVAEAALLPFRRPSRPGFVLAGALGVLWTLVHPLVTGMVIFGRELLLVWFEWILEGARLLGLDASGAAVWVASLLVGSRLVIGGVAGWLAWSGGHVLLRRSGWSGGVEKI